MKNKHCTPSKVAVALSTVAFSLGPTHSSVAQDETQILGEPPLCEVSTALAVPCPAGDGTCLVLGDNEQRDRLFIVKVDTKAQKLTDQGNLLLVADPEISEDIELSDIEALTLLADAKLLVLASHSRNKRCEGKKKRRQFAVGQLNDGEVHLTPPTASGAIHCEELFTGQIGEGTLGSVCGAIDAAEQTADKIEQLVKANEIDKDEAKSQCADAQPFNIEGALTVSGGEEPEVWLGLRSPLVVRPADDGTETTHAMLLRLDNTSELRFDAVAFLDLDGFGIRALEINHNDGYAIGGPPADSSSPFALFRFDVGDLQPESVITPEKISELPTSSEGIAIVDSVAYIVIDGDFNDGERSCDEPSKYVPVPLPG